jgi:hypothetical protein
MSEKPEADDFDDEEDDVGDSDTQLTSLLRDFDQTKRRSGGKAPEPAWRRLEKYREQRDTKALISDFEDYEFDDDVEKTPPSKPKTATSKHKRPPRDD